MIAAGFVNDDGKADRGKYALRHTYATMALRAGLPTFTVARRLPRPGRQRNRGTARAALPDRMHAPQGHRLARLTRGDLG
jgi:hypothetical protein